MTQDKELLLKDLCSRIPYGVKMNHIADEEICPLTLVGVAKDMITLQGAGGYACTCVEDYKPYLFPLSSMTEEQHNEFFTYFHDVELKEIKTSGDYLKAAYLGENAKRDWLNKNHFDYRGLIEKGLAIDATGKGIY